MEEKNKKEVTKMVRNTELSKSQIETLTGFTNFLTIKDIAKYRKTSRTAIYKTIKILENKLLLEKIDKGIYEVTNLGKERLQSTSEYKNKIRLHNFAIKINILESPRNWDLKRNNILTLKCFNKQVNLNKNNNYEISSFKNIKVKTTPKSVIFYMPTFYGNNVEKALQKAMNSLFDTIPRIESQFKIKLIKDRKTNLEIISQHYARLNDALAKIYKREGKKLYIRGEDDKVWLIADYSFSTSELETIHTIKAQDDMSTVENFMNDLRKNPVTFSEVKEIVIGLTKNIDNVSKNQLNQSNQIEQFAIALNRHIPAYEGMTKEVKKLQITINKLTDSVNTFRKKNKKQNLGSQSTLSNFT